MAQPAKPAPPPALVLAIEQFNSGDYFQCHETLEALWRGGDGPELSMYQGIIQIAAGLHHAKNGNRHGALALLERGLGNLRNHGPPSQGVDVAGLMAHAHRWHELVSAAADGLPGLPWEQAPMIRKADMQ
ncbi:MAG: DUF309 domain-containing protein [Chloroflexi bacterium]|nr:DUF309 domain-containing protein [Chloroflexota bacterium]